MASAFSDTFTFRPSCIKSIDVEYEWIILKEVLGMRALG